MESALNLKLREEDILKEELRTATEVHMEQAAILSGLENRLNEIYASLREIETGSLDIIRTRYCSGYVPLMIDRIREQEELTEASRIEMEQVRDKLIRTITERKVMEKLKGRQYREYLQECLRQEQKEIDEMAVARFMHQDSAV